MDKLSYGLLSLLSTEPMTEYDLTNKINRFWHSTHNTIYPILSDLEEQGYVQLTIGEHSDGNPDKKLYILTAQGMDALHDWFISNTNDAVIRDEMTLKLYCIKCMNHGAAKKLLDELEARYNSRLEHYENTIENIKLSAQENSNDGLSSLFGGYILTQRVLNEAKVGIQWCQWVRKIYETEGFEFTNIDFD